MAAPTFVAEHETNWDDADTPKATASFNVQVGDVLIGFAGAEQSQDFDNGIVLTGGTGAWTQEEEQEPDPGNNDHSYAVAYSKVVGTAESMQGSFSGAGTTGDAFGGNVLQFRDSDGVGASASTNNNLNSGAPSLNITTTQDNSAIVVFVADWNASSGTGRTWRTVNGIAPTAGNGFEVTFFRDAAAYSVFGAYYPDAGTAGLKTVGLTTPSAARYVIVAVEVLGAVGGGAETGRGPLVAGKLVGGILVRRH